MKPQAGEKGEREMKNRKNRVRVASIGMSYDPSDLAKNNRQRKKIMHLTDAQCLQIVNQECDCGMMGKLHGAKHGRYTLKNWREGWDEWVENQSYELMDRFPRKGTKRYNELARLSFGILKNYDKEAFNSGILHDSVCLSNGEIFDVDISSKGDFGEAVFIECLPVVNNSRIDPVKVMWRKVGGKWRKA